MGYGINRFVGHVDANLICGICSAVLEEPVLTSCGHTFCLLCLETWLGRPGTNTCPECRTRCMPNEARPILSLRNLISGMRIQCDYESRGCQAAVKLDTLQKHLDGCDFFPVECAGCAHVVNRCELADHQIQCVAIAAVVSETETTSRFDNNEVGVLSGRVTSLELQLRRVKKDLDLAEFRNKKLERELKKTRDDLEEKRAMLIEHQFVDFDPHYEYGYAPRTISKLACLISRFLGTKPEYVDRNRVFNSIKRCYDNYSRCPDYHKDVQMLMAVAAASAWFTENQKVDFTGWLHSLVRYSKYTMHASYTTAESTPGVN